MALLGTILSGITVGASFRRLVSSYTGYCCRILRDSDSATQDFGFDSGGVLDIDAVESWLGSAHGYVTRWYRQDGAGGYMDVYGARIAASGVVQVDSAGRPRMYFDGVDDYASLSNLALDGRHSTHLLLQVTSESMVVEHNTDANEGGSYITNTGYNAFVSRSSGERGTYGASNWMPSASPGVVSMIAGSELRNYVGSTEQVSFSRWGSGGYAGDVETYTLYVFSRAGSAIFSDGYLSEIVICSGQDNTATLSDIVENMLDEWPPVSGGTTHTSYGICGVSSIPKALSSSARSARGKSSNATIARGRSTAAQAAKGRSVGNQATKGRAAGQRSSAGKSAASVVAKSSASRSIVARGYSVAQSVDVCRSSRSLASRGISYVAPVSIGRSTLSLVADGSAAASMITSSIAGHTISSRGLSASLSISAGSASTVMPGATTGSGIVMASTSSRGAASIQMPAGGMSCFGPTSSGSAGMYSVCSGQSVTQTAPFSVSRALAAAAGFSISTTDCRSNSARYTVACGLSDLLTVSLARTGLPEGWVMISSMAIEHYMSQSVTVSPHVSQSITVSPHITQTITIEEAV